MDLKIKSSTKTVVSKTKVPIIKVSGDQATAFYAVCALARKAVAVDPSSVSQEVITFLEAVDHGQKVVEAETAPTE